VTTINSNSRTGSGRPAPNLPSPKTYIQPPFLQMLPNWQCVSGTSVPDAPAELREVGNERMEMCALGSPKPDESTGSRRTGAAGPAESFMLANANPAMDPNAKESARHPRWTVPTCTEPSRVHSSGSCAMDPFIRACRLLLICPNWSGGRSSLFFWRSKKRQLQLDSRSGLLPAVQAGGLNAALPRAGPALFREGVIAFFSSSEVLRAAISGGCFGPAAEVAVFSISEESGAVEVQGLSVPACQYRLS